MVDGLAIFESLNNDMNSVILATNLGMTYRTEAYAIKTDNEAAVSKNSSMSDSIKRAAKSPEIDDDLDEIRAKEKTKNVIKKLVPSSSEERECLNLAVIHYEKAIKTAQKLNQPEVKLNALMNLSTFYYYAVKDTWLKDVKAYLKRNDEKVMELIAPTTKLLLKQLDESDGSFFKAFIKASKATVDAAMELHCQPMAYKTFAERAGEIFVEYEFTLIKNYFQIK